MSSERSKRDSPRGGQGMMASSFTFARVAGIPIGAHWSWLFVFGLVAWSLATQWFPISYPDLPGWILITMGIVSAVLFFGSVLLHELGHAIVAIREGMEMDGITLWLFGGVAKFKGTFPSAGSEFRIAIGGPLVSLLLVGVFWALSVAADGLEWHDAFLGSASYLARINAIVLVFNLVPALPLDGGRILRSALWQRQKNFLAATRTAALAGKAFALVLIGLGVLSLVSDSIIGDIWLAFIGVFLWQAARAEEQYAIFAGALDGLRVRDLMVQELIPVHPTLGLDAFADFVGETSETRFPVVSDAGLLGVISGRMLGAVDARDRARMTVSDVMEDAPDLPVLDASQEARGAIEVLAQPGSRALVREEDSIVGIVTSGDLARAFQIGLGRSDSKGRAGPFAWTVVIASMAVVVGALYYPPVLIQEPGPTLDVIEDIKIEGLEVTDVNGKYLLTSVSIEERNFWGTILASFDPDTDLVRIETFYPEGIDPAEVDRRSRGEFNDSRTSAAVAAAEALGLEVIKGTGARVVDVVDDTPASEVLEADDVIVAVDGAPIRLVTELQAVVRGSPPGTTFSMTVERQGTLQPIEVTSEEIDTEGVPTTAIGVLIETRDEDIQLAFEISFTERDIGGPSAGLVYALAIADLLDEADLANGRSIAATGTIDLNGQVGLVGGLEQKAIGAKDGEAELFLLPSQDEGPGKIDGLMVIEVETLIEALEALRGR